MVLRTPIAVVLLALLVGAAPVRGADFTVCTLSFHGEDEIAVFERHLASPGFTSVSLAPADKAMAGRRSWLENACRADRRCDVVVLSGEFGGRFFGDYGFSLGLQELEEASCDPACAGIFRDPLEVFLLGCNTLATKDQDERTPRDYLRVLQDHGFDQAAAERVVQMRYGPVGPSFRESLRRVFSGVPRLYGFASVAPRGTFTAPMLERYFRSTGDYATYLERLGRSTAQNAHLASAFGQTSFVQANGLAESEPAARDRDLVCRMYDERRSVAERMRTASEIMQRSDFLAFLPTLQVFFGRHPPDDLDGDERATFAAMRDASTGRDEVLRLARDLEVSALKLEVADFARRMEWMTPSEFHRLAVDGARALLARMLTSEIVDIECVIAAHERIGDAIRSDDLPGSLFQNAEGIRLVDCVAPSDARVNGRLAAALDDADESVRLWAAYALSRRLPLEEPVLKRLTAHLGDESPEMRDRVGWIMTAQRDLSHSVRALASNSDGARADGPSRHGRYMR